ncbi:MAG: hypothetical protein ACETWR_06850 [Anaerolineae bacterium]
MLAIARDNAWRLVRYESRYGFQSYYLASPEQVAVLQIDVFNPYHWKGLTWISKKKILDSRRSYGTFHIPDSGVEAAILLLKDLLRHGFIKERYKARIMEMSSRAPDNFYAALCEQFGDTCVRRLLEKTKQGDWEGLIGMQQELRRTLLLRAIVHNPWGQLVCWGKFLFGRLVEGLFRPTGFFLVLIGPDGAGKTSVASGVKELLQPALYKEVRTFHFRPGVLPGLRPLRRVMRRTAKAERSTDDSEDQQGAKSPSSSAGAENGLIWLIRLSYYTFDFLLGHFQVWFNKAGGRLVIYDRYYYEYIIQQAEAPLPAWLPRLLMRVVPQPDAVIYLSNSAAAIFDRKQELSLPEIERQSERYEELVAELPGAHRVRTDGSLGEAVERVGRIVVETMAERYKTIY